MESRVRAGAQGCSGNTILCLLPNHGTNPWKSQYLGMPASFPGEGEPAWRGMLCGAHPQVLQHPGLLLTGIPLGLQGQGAGSGLWEWRGAAQPRACRLLP